MAPPIAIVRGEGALLFDEKGVSYIDAISSWWVNIHGHGHPYIAEKIYEQARKLEHVIFTGFTHAPAVHLAERLLPRLPGSFSRVFYSDNGSTAVEVAIKMCIQYWQNHPGTPSPLRRKILALKHAYHGDTFGAMSVSERGPFTLAFREYLFEVVFIDTPTPANIAGLKSQIQGISDEIACFIYEPLLQAAGGMHMYDAASLDALLQYLGSLNVLTISDEVMTGFGRTGKWFAGEYLQFRPDIICLSKGLSGGSMAMGITACSKRIFDAFLSQDKTKTFFHGHSFTGNPIACAAALASLDLLEREETAEGIRRISEGHGAFIQKIMSEPRQLHVKNLRQLGTVMAFEWSEGEDHYLNRAGEIITGKALEDGIYLRPLGNTVYLMPPYCITGAQLDKIYRFLFQLCRESGRP
jgi:adenosylmethionine-8-amino-7-oxononanoate aminotransferase